MASSINFPPGNVTLHPDDASEILTTEINHRAADFPAEEIKTLSPLVLAHVGDAYFHLYIRTRLLQVTHNITRLHDLSAQIVSATAQAKTYHAIENFLTDAERDIFRRGRNAKSHAPRKATVAEYHASTGFEALLGELYLRKNFSRLDEICELAFREASP
ncbi:MAG: ribonuclease III [Selenomonadaceae bacterium]|nr:ribonuclease III [Selenomonadaceae bacterium]